MAFDSNFIVSILKKHPLGLSAFGVAILLFVGISVRSGSMEDLTLELEEVSAQGERLKNNLKYAAQLDEQLMAISAASLEISERAINPSSLASNLQHFYRLESDLGVEYTDLRQGVASPPAAGASFIAVPYTVSVQGTYAQLLNYLRRLETGMPFVRFTTTNLSPSRIAGAAAQDPTNPILSLTLGIELLGKQ
jgi:hypothetical protein